jgi:hypothetical protein
VSGLCELRLLQLDVSLLMDRGLLFGASLLEQSKAKQNKAKERGDGSLG